jgi:hypothetical protein
MKQQLDAAKQEAETQRRAAEDAYAEVANEAAKNESAEHDDPSALTKLRDAEAEITSLEQHVEKTGDGRRGDEQGGCEGARCGTEAGGGAHGKVEKRCSRKSWRRRRRN